MLTVSCDVDLQFYTSVSHTTESRFKKFENKYGQ